MDNNFSQIFTAEEPHIEDLTTAPIFEEEHPEMSHLTFDEVQALESYGFSFQAGASSTRHEHSDGDFLASDVPSNLNASHLDAELMLLTPERDVLALAKRVENGEIVDHSELQSSPVKHPASDQATPMKTNQDLEDRHVTFASDVMIETQHNQLPKTPKRRSNRLTERSSSEKKKDQEPKKARAKPKLSRNLKAKKKNGAKKLAKKSK